MACDFYEVMETAWCEVVGVRYMFGIVGNIDARIVHEVDWRGYV